MKRKLKNKYRTSPFCTNRDWKDCKFCQQVMYPLLMDILYSFPSVIVRLISELNHDDLAIWMNKQFAPALCKFLNQISAPDNFSLLDQQKHVSNVTRKYYYGIMKCCETLIDDHVDPILCSIGEVTYFFKVLRQTLESLNLTMFSQCRQRKIQNTLSIRECKIIAHVNPEQDITSLLSSLGKTDRDTILRYCASLSKKRTKTSKT